VDFLVTHGMVMETVVSKGFDHWNESWRMHVPVVSPHCSVTLQLWSCLETKTVTRCCLKFYHLDI